MENAAPQVPAPATLTLRAFKNRALASFGVDEAARVWDDQMYWAEFGGPLIRQAKLDERYPGYHVWEADGSARLRVGPEDPPAEMSLVMPCKALVVLEHSAGGHRAYDAHVLQCPTVNVHPPRQAPAPGYAVLDLDDGKLSVDLGALPDTLWRQLGTTGSAVVHLVRLKKTGHFQAFSCKDDLTGEAYAYLVSRVLRLERAPAV